MIKPFYAMMFAFGLSIGSLGGCDRQDADEAAEKTGSAIENAMEKTADVLDGNAEEAGQAVQRGMEKTNEAFHNAATRPTTLPAP